MKSLHVVFYASNSGKEPVREWLLTLNSDDRKKIGKDINKIEYGWPIGLPVCKKLESGLYEVRTELSGKRIARVIFSIDGNSMVLLDGFIKKQQKTPKRHLETARKRLKGG